MPQEQEHLDQEFMAYRLESEDPAIFTIVMQVIAVVIFALTQLVPPLIQVLHAR